MDKGKNIFYIDVLRIISAIFIVLLHSSSISYSFFAQDSEFVEKIFLKELWVVSRFAVPIFVMITGALLLNRNKVITWEMAISKYAFRIIVVLLTIGFGFTWLEIIFDDKAICVSQIPNALFNLVIGRTWDHLWYLYMLIGLYLVTPIIKAFVDNTDMGGVDIALGVLVLFTICFPYIKSLWNIDFGIKLPFDSVYLFYLLLGYRLRNTDILSSKVPYICSLFVLVLLSIILLVWYQEFTENNYSIGYDHPLIFLLSANIFCIFKSLFAKCTIPILGLKQFATLSFGVYVFHPLWLNVITKLININPLKYHLLSLFSVIFVVIVLSLLTTILYRKIPYIGKYL